MTSKSDSASCGCNSSQEIAQAYFDRLAADEAAGPVADTSAALAASIGAIAVGRGLLIDPVGIFATPLATTASTVGVKVKGNVDGNCRGGFATLRLEKGKYILVINSKGGGDRCGVVIATLVKGAKQQPKIPGLTGEEVNPGSSESFLFTLPSLTSIIMDCKGTKDEDVKRECVFSYEATFLS